MKFIPIFGDSWNQVRKCIVANEQFAVTLIGEMGTHAQSGEVFDSRAVHVTRFDKDGKSERVWTIDLDSEDTAEFSQRNPVTEP